MSTKNQAYEAILLLYKHVKPLLLEMLRRTLGKLVLQYKSFVRAARRVQPVFQAALLRKLAVVASSIGKILSLWKKVRSLLTLVTIKTLWPTAQATPKTKSTNKAKPFSLSLGPLRLELSWNDNASTTRQNTATLAPATPSETTDHVTSVTNTPNNNQNFNSSTTTGVDQDEGYAALARYQHMIDIKASFTATPSTIDIEVGEDSTSEVKRPERADSLVQRELLIAAMRPCGRDYIGEEFHSPSPSPLRAVGEMDDL